MGKPRIRRPTGLPKPDGPPQNLPPVQERTSGRDAGFDSALQKARLCPGCGKEGRVVSNRLGVNVYCGPCKRHWPVTNGPLRPETPVSVPRGFRKQTLVEPNWDLAFDDIQGPDGS